MVLYARLRQVKITKTGKEIFDRKATEKAIQEHLEYLRGEIMAERISYSEIIELQELKKFISLDDNLLLEWAGVPEFDNEE
jgi:hypothetical protein